MQEEAGAYLRTFPRRVCVHADQSGASAAALDWAAATLLQPPSDEVHLVHSAAASPPSPHASSLSRLLCSGGADDDVLERLQADEEERVWAEDTLDRFEARCRAAGLAAVHREAGGPVACPAAAVARAASGHGCDVLVIARAVATAGPSRLPAWRRAFPSRAGALGRSCASPSAR